MQHAHKSLQGLPKLVSNLLMIPLLFPVLLFIPSYTKAERLSVEFVSFITDTFSSATSSYLLLLGRSIHDLYSYLLEKIQ